MDIKSWLNELGLSEYATSFSKHEIDLKMIPELTDDDLKELGIIKLGHRKKVLKAIFDLSSGRVDTISISSTKPLPSLSACTATWPYVVALPLHEYIENQHPSVRLWAACDTVELLLRFLVMTMVADRQRLGELDDKVLKDLWVHIELPTLGAWLVMARSLSQGKMPGDLIVPEAASFIEEHLTPLLYGPSKPGTAETSFLRLRNRLAHGGGFTMNQAERMLTIWQKPFEETMLAAGWLADLSLLGRDDGQAYLQMNGMLRCVPANIDTTILLEPEHNDVVWMVRGRQYLTLWPLAAFGKPNDSQSGRTSEEDALQIYSRKDVVQLQYTPMGLDSFNQSEAGGTALAAFQRLFRFDKASAQLIERSFKVSGFEKDIRRDASQMIGREEEIELVRKMINERRQGIIWLTGAAGMGKSFLMAKLAIDLMDEHAQSDTIVLPYRFKAGDDMRCRRDALADFVEERLVAAGALSAGGKDKKNKAEERLEACMNQVKLDKHVIILMDGLDEIAHRDADFAEEVPLKLRYPNLLWVCSGRSEPKLMESMRIYKAEMPYSDGLPPMQAKDIRGMLMEKIGPLRKKLLAQDKENGEMVVNPFIEQVTRRAAGVPLYVRYVIQDVLSGRYRVLDGNENLPASLHAYHEELLKRLGVGDLQTIVTPLVATLAVAHESLAADKITIILQMRGLVPKSKSGEVLVGKGLGAIASMLRLASNSDGEEGFTLFHKSLSQHVLESDSMKINVLASREAFAKAGLEPEKVPEMAKYLYRMGIDHLLDVGMTMDAKEKLLSLAYFGKLKDLGKDETDIFKYWRRIEDSDHSSDYCKAVETELKQKPDEKLLDTVIFICDLCHSAGWFRQSDSLAQLALDVSLTFLGEEHRITQKAYVALGTAFHDKGKYKKAEEIFHRSVKVLERVFGLEHPDTLRSAVALAGLLVDNGDYKSAEPFYCRAIEVFEHTLGSKHPDTLGTMNGFATLLAGKGDYESAEKIYRKTVETIERNFGPEHRFTLTAVSNLAELLNKKGDFKMAESMCRRVLEVSERLLGSEHPDTLVSMNNLVGILADKGDFEAAESLSHRVLEISKRTLGPEHPKTLVSIGNLIELLSLKGDNEAAEPLCRSLLEVSVRTLGPEHPDTVFVYKHLAQVSADMGEFQEAEALYNRAILILEQIRGREHPETIEVMGSIADLLTDKGDYEAAEPLHRWAYEICTRNLGSEHPNTLISQMNLGAFLSDKGEYKEAEMLLRHALESYDRAFGSEHINTLGCVNLLAELLKKKGDHAAAKPLLGRLADFKRTHGGEQSEKLDSENSQEKKSFSKSISDMTETELKNTLDELGNELGPNHPDVLGWLILLAENLQKKGDLDGAESLYRRLVEAAEHSDGAEAQFTLNSLNELGGVLIQKKDYNAAEPIFRRIFEISERTLGSDHPDTLTSLNNLGGVLADIEDFEGAVEALSRALDGFDRIYGPQHPETRSCMNLVRNVINKVRRKNGN